MRDSETRLRQIIDLVPHMIFAKDRHGRFILANRAMAEAYGTIANRGRMVPPHLVKRIGAKVLTHPLGQQILTPQAAQQVNVSPRTTGQLLALKVDVGQPVKAGETGTLAIKLPLPPGSAHEYTVPWQAFQTKDGYLVIATRQEIFWKKLCTVLGDESIGSDPRFATNEGRVEHRATLVPRRASRRTARRGPPPHTAPCAPSPRTRRAATPARAPSARPCRWANCCNASPAISAIRSAFSPATR